LHGCDQISGSVGDGHRVEPFDDRRGIETCQIVSCQEVAVDGMTVGRGRRGFGRGRGGTSGENEGGGERRGGGDDHLPPPGRGGVRQWCDPSRVSDGSVPDDLAAAPTRMVDQRVARRSCICWISVVCASMMVCASSMASGLLPSSTCVWAISTAPSWWAIICSRNRRDADRKSVV